MAATRVTMVMTYFWKTPIGSEINAETNIRDINEVKLKVKPEVKFYNCARLD